MEEKKKNNVVKIVAGVVVVVLIIAMVILVNNQTKKEEAKKQLELPPFDGQNPQVFQYKFMGTDSNDVILWMRFYEGFDVFIIPNTNTSQPDEISV